jgi:hypothetical protein
MSASVLGYFEHAFVINLPERTDRRGEIERELARANLSFGDGHIELFPAIRPTELGGFWNHAVRGCFLSHLGVMERAIEQKLKSVLIMEVLQHQQEVIEQLRQQPWDIAYLGHIQPLDPPADRAVGFTPADPAKMLITLHFYALNRSVLPRLVQYLHEVLKRPAGHPLGGPMHVDGAISMFRKLNPDVVTLLAQPSLGSQRPSPSDLSPRWFDHAPVVRTLARAARSIHRRMKSR